MKKLLIIPVFMLSLITAVNLSGSMLVSQTHAYNQSFGGTSVSNKTSNKFYNLIKNHYREKLDKSFSQSARKKGMDRKVFYKNLVRVIDTMKSRMKDKNNRDLLMALTMVIDEEVFSNDTTTTTKTTTSNTIVKQNTLRDTNNPASYKDFVKSTLEVSSKKITKYQKLYYAGNGKCFDWRSYPSYSFDNDAYRISKLSKSELKNMSLFFVKNENKWVLVE